MYNQKAFLIVLASILTMPNAMASGGMAFTATNAKWKGECGSCHVAYPANMLPAASWKTMMGSLDKHFGSDASLDAPTSAEILAFLEKNASQRLTSSGQKPQLRITETSQFIRKHDEVSAKTWKNPQVKSAANCAACHTQAENGDFSERNIRIPK
jgi:cytochrome c553